MRASKHLPASLIFSVLFSLLASRAIAQPAPTKLPREDEHQRKLVAFLATLQEKDFEPDRSKPFTAATPADDEEAYRLWVVSLEPPRIGLKRSATSVNSLSKYFTLAEIESTEGVMRPSAWPEPLTYLANWNYAGNPYYNSRAIKLRAFVTASIDLLMMDQLQEHSRARMHQRSDWFGPHLVMYAYVYAGTRDVLPAAAKEPFEAILKKMILRVAKWGPTADETWLDVSVTTGMAIAGKTINDPELKKVTEEYAKKIYTDGPFYNGAAGHFVDSGCYDTAFSGLALYWGTFAAEAGDWPFAKEAVARAWELRGYLILPDPDGKRWGPSHMTYRAGADVAHDQWDWPFRAVAASHLTDQALGQAKQPTPGDLKEAPAKAAQEINWYLSENSGKLPADQVKPNPWRWMLWPDTGAFPVNNFAYDYCPKDYYAHYTKLVKENSPLLKLPFEREGMFLKTFGNDFTIAKEPAYGVIVHSGAVGAPSETPMEAAEFPGPYGLGGGTLSAFWTPATGSVILGRRAGMAIVGPEVKSFDKVEAWRTWPVHSISGATASGKYFSSARIQKPEVKQEMHAAIMSHGIRVSGTLPAASVGHEKSLEGKTDYSRTFVITLANLRVETTLKSDGKDKLAELYEVIPVFKGMGAEKDPGTTTIEFQVGGAWTPATAEAKDGVAAIRLSRFTGAVVVTLDKPRRVKLSAEDWKDNYLAAGLTCRNVLIDLLEGKSSPTTIGEVKISYTIAPAGK